MGLWRTGGLSSETTVHMFRSKIFKIGVPLVLALLMLYYIQYYGLLQMEPSSKSMSFPTLFTSIETEPKATEGKFTEAKPTETKVVSTNPAVPPGEARRRQIAAVAVLEMNKVLPQKSERKLQSNAKIAQFSESHTTTSTAAVKLQKMPTIVFWAKQFHNIDWTFPRLANGDGGCEVSFDRKDLHRADAVVFFMKSANPNDLPPANSRRKDQVYVWFVHESPWTVRNYYHHKLTEYNNYFNWTMSFRMDSGVMAAMWPTPAMDFLMSRVGRKEEMADPDLASKVRLSKKDFQTQARALLSKKKKLVAWIVSDCDITRGAKQRVSVVRNLEDTGIQISKYGKCVHNPLPFNFTIVFQTLSQYKFYLAFENSIHCQDYITEKAIYNSLVSGAVPVIHGSYRKDAAKVLPKGSYIHAEDFENMQKLKDYLDFLDKNDTAYMQYFKWWRNAGAQTFPRFGFNYGPEYVPRNPIYPMYNKNDLQDDWLEYERFGVYHLCRRLKRGDHKNQVHIVPDLAKEWYDREPPECLN